MKYIKIIIAALVLASVSYACGSAEKCPTYTDNSDAQQVSIG